MGHTELLNSIEPHIKMALQIINPPNFINCFVKYHMSVQQLLVVKAFSKYQGHTVYTTLPVSLSQNRILGQRDH